MNRNDLFEKIVKLESNVNVLTQEMTELKSLAIQLIEENVTLQVENDNLKALMAKSEQDVESTKVNSEGFHICNGELFGKHRYGEDCLLCMNVLNS